MKVLKLIMSVGAGYLVITAFGAYYCAGAFPLQYVCIRSTVEATMALNASGFTVIMTSASTLVSGAVIYYMTGGWKNN